MGCGHTTIKYLLALFNFMFAIGGLLLIVFGSIAKANAKRYLENFEANISGPAILFIVIGCIIFLISLLGCCGAVQESHSFLFTYAALVTVIVFAQVVGAILVFVKGRKEDDKVHVQLLAKSQELYNSAQHKQFWDLMQRDLKCCGVWGPSEWPNDLNMPTPISCECKQSSADCDGRGLYKTGCLSVLRKLAKKKLVTLGVISLTVTLVQVLIVIFACILASEYKRQKSYTPMV